jgi:hypothetical protein
MMLGHPEAPVAEPLGRLRELERVAQRLAGVGPFGHRGEIEDGEGDHSGEIGTPSSRRKPGPRDKKFQWVSTRSQLPPG